MKKKLVIAGAVATVGLAGLGTAAYATNNSASSGDAAKREAKVQLTDEQKAAKKAEHEQRMKDDLAQLVKDGKLTQDQADKLFAKREELKKWLQEQDLDESYARYLGGHGGRGGERHGKKQPTSSETDTNKS